VLARLRNGTPTDDAVVDRLNALSLRAAEEGKTFSPRLVTARFLSAQASPPSPDKPRRLSPP
jgi:hypothetical protein